MKFILKIYFTLITIFYFNSSYAQIDIEKLLTKRYLNCDDIFYNNSELIPKYQKNKSTDTLSALIVYWENECGLTEIIFRTKKLFQIENSKFSNNNILDQVTFFYLNDYISTKNLFNEYYQKLLENNKLYPTNRLMHKNADYYNFTQQWARKLLQKEKLDKVSKIILQIYANNETNIEQLAQKNNVKIEKENLFSQTKKNTHLNKKFFETDIGFGIWIPTNKLKIVGEQPSFILKIGGLFLDSKNAFNIEFGGTFNDAEHEYMSVNNDTLMHTKTFANMHCTINFSYDIIAKQKNQIYYTLGIGYGGIMTFNAKESLAQNNKEIYINSLIFNTGIGYRHIFNQQFLIGLEAKYHMVNYKNVCGTNLSGDYFNISLIIGILQ